MQDGRITMQYTLKNEKIEIGFYGNHNIEECIEKIIDYIFWLGDCKKELIKFYNKELSEETDEKADNDWYDTLEVYSVNIGIAVNGKLFAEISKNFRISLILF